MYEAPDFPDVARGKPKVWKPSKQQKLELAGRIEQARVNAGEDNASEFARGILVTPTTLYRWQKGTVVPDIWSLSRLAKATRTSMEWLVSGEAAAGAELRAYMSTAHEAGRDLLPDEISFLIAVPLMGMTPSPAFFDYALVAYRNGLSPTEAGRAATTSLQLVPPNS